MRPTVDEVRTAAYDRWERRGWTHGGDGDDWLAAETELTFHARYRTVVEMSLDGPDRRVLARGAGRHCCFCERTPGQADFGDPRPVVPGRSSLLTAEVCDDCQFEWRDGLAEDFDRFWARLERGRPQFTVASFKALVAGALLILPGRELPLFVDTLEWVSNPDHDADNRLLDGAGCVVYRAPFLEPGARASLVRRVDDDDPVPYMLYFLASDGIIVQVELPMCLCDEDLDGREVERLQRVFSAGRGAEFREARAVLLPLSVAERRPRLAIAS
jgi:Protein of unknown function (DUF2934)